MGYKYGIWLVYDALTFYNISNISPTHIGHFTISCNMEYNDAVNLYHKLFEQFGDYSTMCVSGKSVVFPKGLYQNATSDLYAWGYEATNSLWEYYKNTCNSELGDFAEIPHTSIQYSKFNFLQSYVDSKHIDDFQIRCKMCLVDITNDNPIEWNILQC